MPATAAPSFRYARRESAWFAEQCIGDASVADSILASIDKDWSLHIDAAEAVITSTNLCSVVFVEHLAPP